MGHALDAAGEQSLVEEVTLDAPGAVVEIDWPAVVIALGIAMDLRRQVVEHRHRIAARQQGIDQVGADEARPTGHKRVFAQGVASARTGWAAEAAGVFGRVSGRRMSQRSCSSASRASRSTSLTSARGRSMSPFIGVPTPAES